LDREKLIRQVKDEYARLARLGSQSHFIDQTTSPAAAYYEKALQAAINGITAGKFDDCITGKQVVERIANSPQKPTELS